ncbi:MAG: nucleotidyltransferase family protein [Wenzhouxiangellaceae bacterium]
MITQALILAAGRGERLRPLTDHCPKALVEVGGRALLDWHLLKLAQAGIEQVVINTHHLAAQLHAHVENAADHGMHIRFSDEQPQALETLGGIVRARRLLCDEPFLLVNADVHVACDYRQLVQASVKASGPQALLLLVPNPAHHPRGDFSLRNGLLQTSHTAPTYTYSGLAAMHPALIADIPDDGTPRPLAPLLQSKAKQQLIAAELLRGGWFDVGTPARLSACREHLRGSCE